MEQEGRNQSKVNTLKRIGLLIVALSFGFLFLIFYPVVFSEVRYFLNPPSGELEPVLETSSSVVKNYIVADDKNFSLIIPKIGVNVKVIENVDPLDSSKYQKVLSEGIAHAMGSAFPGRGKNTFLFAHSSDSFLNANRYNSVFYLLSKMQEEDLFYVVFEEKIYKYFVLAKEIVKPDVTELMEPDFGTDTVILMTCWPPGTDSERLVVVGKLAQ